MMPSLTVMLNFKLGFSEAESGGKRVCCELSKYSPLCLASAACGPLADPLKGQKKVARPEAYIEHAKLEGPVCVV